MRIKRILACVAIIAVACASGDVDKEGTYSWREHSSDSASQADEDGDGYSTEDDCNDEDAQVHPCASDQRGDDLDSNCDGSDGVVVSCEEAVGGDDCCVHCGADSTPCGDSCISNEYECHQGDGCACY